MTDITTIKHIAIIPDGNRRWAKEHGLPALEGHRRGAQNFDRLSNAIKDLNIPFFSTWAFSTENWKRSEEEVSYLFNILRDLIKKYETKFMKEETRFVQMGRKDRLPKDILQMIKNLENKTSQFNKFTFLIGLDYGGHDEIVRAVNTLLKEEKDVTEENLEKSLDTKGFPPPDLIIRTSGEQRFSGFMSWQCAYSEFYFSNLHFPDFGKGELKKAVEECSNRSRRFGGN